MSKRHAYLVEMILSTINGKQITNKKVALIIKKTATNSRIHPTWSWRMVQRFHNNLSSTADKLFGCA